MGTKENFNQAMHEVFTFRKNTKEIVESAEVNTTNLAEKLETVETTPNEPLDFQSSYETKMQLSIETTHISKDTRITGTIESKSHLDICGDVFGDVDSINNIKVSGRVEGNITGKRVEINNAIIKGDIHAKDSLIIENESEVFGNIFASELELNSKLNGNINVKKGARILKNSTVNGDITAASINVESGALIKSMMNITGERKSLNEEDPQ